VALSTKEGAEELMKPVENIMATDRRARPAGMLPSGAFSHTGRRRPGRFGLRQRSMRPKLVVVSSLPQAAVVRRQATVFERSSILVG
jgi:hypothetical protein